jgi:curved DNA-binding protein CbpA
MGGVDHYAVLGVKSDASAREIRRAYRRLARQRHPDLNPDSNGGERFAQLAHAYAVLNDPAQRARYDQARSPDPARPPTVSRSRVSERTFQHGILELSPREVWHLARHPLMLTDGHGRTLVLPAGVGDGDQITLFYDGRPVVLTVQFQRET